MLSYSYPQERNPHRETLLAARKNSQIAVYILIEETTTHSCWASGFLYLAKTASLFVLGERLNSRHQRKGHGYMNTDIKAHVIGLLETYARREQQIRLLHYELQHSVRISPKEMIDGMALGHGDSMGVSSKGHISDKTMYIALNYQERVESMNAEAVNEIAQRLLALEEEQNRIRYYVSLLEQREAEAIRLFYFEGYSWEDTAKEVGVVLRTVYKIKNRAINHLATLYAYTTNLN